MLPVEVLEKVQKDLLNYDGSGQSVMEMSHRSKDFQKIIDDAEADLRDLMKIPDNYKVMFLQGGGTLQFAMIPLNLLRNSKKADYVITGTWAKKAYKEACKFGDIKVIEYPWETRRMSGVLPSKLSVSLVWMFSSKKGGGR